MLPMVAERLADLETACRTYHVQRLEMFGSASKGTHQPGVSDLDFLVEFHEMCEGSYANAYFGLLELLETLFECSVDLVVDSAIKNPYFRQVVDQTKELVYGA